MLIINQFPQLNTKLKPNTTRGKLQRDVRTLDEGTAYSSTQRDMGASLVLNSMALSQITRLFIPDISKYNVVMASSTVGIASSIYLDPYFFSLNMFFTNDF